MQHTLERPEQEQTKRKKRLPLWARLLLGLLGILLALVALAALYLNGKLDLIRYDDGTLRFAGSIDATEDQDLDGTGLEHTEEEMQLPADDPFASEAVLNILLISTDERTDAVNDAAAFTHLNELDGTSDTTEFSEDARADSLILVSLNIKEDTIRLVSIERGTGVPITLPEYEGEYDWITHTFRYGGAKLTMDTVESCFGVQMDHYVRINFNSFVQIVDAVGGIDVDLTELEAKALNWEVPSNSMLIVNKVSPGINHFDGYTALQYARLRKIDNDWQRVARQRTVIQAVLDQIKSASVLELDDLLNTVLPLVQTNFTKGEIASLLTQLPAFLGVQTEQLSLPAEGTYGVRTGMDDRLMYDPDWSVNRRILQRFLYGATTDADVRSYLRDNSTALDWGAKLTDEAFGNAAYGLFLLGKTEGPAQNYTAKKALLQYLHESQGVNMLLEDCGPASALLLEEYLNTGDATLLAQYRQGQEGTPRDTEEENDFWQRLYRYNQTQPQANRLHVAGIGTEQSRDTALAGLALLLKPDAEIPEDLQSLAFLVRAGNPYAPDKVQAALEKSFYHTQRLFGSYNWSLAKQLLASIARTDALRTAAQSERPALQTAALLADYQFAAARYQEQKFFAQLDTAQVLQHATATQSTGFATQLCAEDGQAGQVCSILPLYAEATTATAETAVGAQQNPAELAEKGVLQTLLPSALRHDTLVALDGPATPFDVRNGFLSEETSETGGATAYFQKVLTFTDLSPCTAYGVEQTPTAAATMG